jgi:hypothetical protein
LLKSSLSIFGFPTLPSYYWDKSKDRMSETAIYCDYVIEDCNRSYENVEQTEQIDSIKIPT